MTRTNRECITFFCFLLFFFIKQVQKKTPPEGFEPSTPGLEVRCAIQLRHGGVITTLVGLEPTTARSEV